MKRRAALRRAGAAGLAALAGCLDRVRPAAPDGSDSPTGTSTPEPAIAAQAFQVTGIRSGGSGEEASVSFEDGVTVTGTITGNNGCYTAVLDAASYGAHGGTDRVLVVDVRAKEETPEGGGVCTQALVDISYEATFELTGPPPAAVLVRHESMGETTTVARVER